MKYYTIVYKTALSDSPETVQIFAGDKSEAKHMAKRELSHRPGFTIIDIYNTKTGK